ncbi:N-acetylglucosamine-6-phosphate deacetylase isoform X2 [Phymastichus coffea]|uniref:N-acetylglucosamine-6-phosphate deacetylase isoform X2 n=1 Tax=Phymastichus coffea TaxID=108790 RepID=UPI00273BF0F0|nr:N-acetylglucosamine-6-phosphate deacetylase isoform X2 [Phymastichus coffea]
MPELNKSQLKQFYNCRILRRGKILTEDLWVRNGRIIDPEKIFYDEKVEPSYKVNCCGAIISPGFIDIQINGGFGIDFSYNTDNVENGINTVAKELLSYGVTSFCPTLVTSPVETYHKVLPKIKKQQGGRHGAAVLGVHVEGPFINPLKKGAHPEKCIKKFENGFQSVLDVYGCLDNICYVTLAPEIDRALEVIKELRRKNIKISVGHSAGDLKYGEQAVKNGATFITHLFNAMLPFHHRDPGLVGLLASDQLPSGKLVYYGIIADGVHTHPAALRIAHRTHPKALGLEEGIHQLGLFNIEVRGGKAYIAGTDTLCGSIADMSECVRFFKRAAGCSVVEALEAATLHPAQALEIESDKGVLNFGAEADLVFLNDDLHVISTWIAGECVYECSRNKRSFTRYTVLWTSI